MYRDIVVGNVEYLHLVDGKGVLHHGADQEWFPLSWQRRAGCGPTTASQLILYNSRANPSLPFMAVEDKDSMIRVMDEVWQYITPGIMGVHLVSHFTAGLQRYLQAKGADFRITTLQIPKKREERPSFDEVLTFIVTRLEAGQPVAFLNLSNGGVANLDPWHWVTVVGVKQETSDAPVHLQIYDAGLSMMIDFTSWWRENRRAAGFVSLVPSQ